jgi:hypothetical protein
VTDRAKGEEEVKKVINQYRVDITPPNVTAEPPAPVDITQAGTQNISWQIGQIYARGWWIWGVLTFIGGVAVLILNNPGFGTVLDLIFSFFWGFGLPTTIEKLQQLGPSGIATDIGNTPFKSTP